MKKRAGFNGGAPPTDLLVCFPSRAHLSLMPKPICSPSRPHHSSPRPGVFRPTTALTNKPQMGSGVGSEPTSPKVTCAGQIKVRHPNRTRRGPNPKGSGLLETVGLKKQDVAGFLAVLRSAFTFKFNLHCFGSFHGPVDYYSSDEGEEDEGDDSGGPHPRAVLSKWFMMLDEEKEQLRGEEEVEVPPKNALLLMRCKSTPAKREEESEERREAEDQHEERLMLMSYAPDFFKLSTDIAKETWVVGRRSAVEPLVRSRSCKR